MISDLKVNSTSSTIHLNWKAPFSLNLSAVHPDIVYCLDIFKVSDLEHHLVSDCSVLDTHYNFVSPDPRALLQFRVTPKSNVEGATNGTPTDTYLFKSKYTCSPTHVLQCKSYCLSCILFSHPIHEYNVLVSVTLPQ